MSVTIKDLAIPIPAEVTALAAEQGVTAQLPAVLEMTRRLFPHARISVELDDDPEIANDRHILVVARGVPSSVEEASETEWAWHRGIFECCPAPLACVFRLRLRTEP
jgi:hypothetical protein